MKRLRSSVRRYLDLYHYYRDAKSFLAFMKTAPDLTKVKKPTKQAAFVLSVWHYTPVAWYCLCFAIFYRLKGFEPVLIWDDLPFSNITRLNDQIRVVEWMLKKLKLPFRILRLSEASNSLDVDAKAKAEVERLCVLYSVMRYRSAIPNADWKPYQERLRGRLIENMSRVKDLLTREKYDHVVIPCGIYGNTSLFLWMAKQLGLRAATHDYGPGLLLTSVDGLAAHMADVTRIFDADFSEAKSGPSRAKIIESAKLELKKRVEAKDQYNLQKVAYGTGEKPKGYDIVMALNVDWDAAALIGHGCFEHTLDWVTQTVKHVLKNTDATIVVRQHPIERIPIYRAKQDLSDALKNLAPGNPRYRFIAAEEDVNTYALIEQAKIVLPFTSTVGIEAAALGKQVILECDAYYSSLPFVEKAQTPDEYFTKIKAALAQPTQLSKDKIEQALICYFASQLANRVFTPYTPMPVDYRRWVLKDFDSFYNDANTQHLLRTLSQGEPVIHWRTREILGAAS